MVSVQEDSLEQAAFECRKDCCGAGRHPGGPSFVLEGGVGPLPPGAPHPRADACLLAASALRTPISITSSYAAPFAMMSHHEMNGSLTSPSAYASLHNIPPQMSAAAAAAAAAYGRSPMVSFGAVRRPFGSFCWGGGDWERSGELVGVVRQLPLEQSVY